MKTRIGTATFYGSPDDSRCRSAQQLVRNAVAKGYSITIVDESRDPAIRRIFQELGADIFQQKSQGMGPGRRELFGILDAEYSGEKGYVAWVEPEKETFPDHIPALIVPLEKDEADIVSMLRSKISLATMPHFQVASERIGDYVFRKVTGINAFPWSGPMVLRREVLQIYQSSDPTRYGAPDQYVQICALMEAAATGYRITTVEVDFLYPDEQKRIEEGPQLREMVEKRLEKQADPLYRLFFSAAEALKLGLYAK